MCPPPQIEDDVVRPTGEEIVGGVASLVKPESVAAGVERVEVSSQRVEAWLEGCPDPVDNLVAVSEKPPVIGLSDPGAVVNVFVG